MEIMTEIKDHLIEKYNTMPGDLSRDKKLLILGEYTVFKFLDSLDIIISPSVKLSIIKATDKLLTDTTLLDELK